MTNDQTTATWRYLTTVGIVIGLGCLLGAGAVCPMSDAEPMMPGMDEEEEEEEEPKSVSFNNEIQPIFNTHCIRCHVTGGFANNSGIPLRLIEGVSYELLVGKKSVQDPSLTLVKPGDPTNSLLFLKISHEMPPVGRRMPWDGGTEVTAEEIELIRIWIEEGAANN